MKDVNDLMQCLTDVCGLEWNGALLTMSLTSDTGISMSAFELKDDVLNINTNHSQWLNKVCFDKQDNSFRLSLVS